MEGEERERTERRWKSKSFDLEAAIDGSTGPNSAEGSRGKTSGFSCAVTDLVEERKKLLDLPAEQKVIDLLY